MSLYPFIFVGPASRGLGLALTRHLLQNTHLPVYATHRSGDPDGVRARIVSQLDPKISYGRLRLLHMDLTQEDSIAAAANALEKDLKGKSDAQLSYLQTAFFTGGILHPERSASDLDWAQMQETFQINTLSHLLLIKHFSRFLPKTRTPIKDLQHQQLAKWVHISARVGSVSDNRLGGWFSYRASKAALNQVVRTWDLQLQQRRIPAMSVAVHPGTVKTELSREFWSGVPEGKLFKPEYAAEQLVKVVQGLKEEQRGRIWDWKGDEILP
jgi:NAD(P)-dependent dehydrogenase (short-subunit alcohol dehydrogenase family)